MNEYIQRIEKSDLPVIAKFNLKMFCYVAEYYERLKAENREPDRIWLQSKLREYGL